MNIQSKNLETAAQLMYDQAFRRKVRNKDPDALAKLGIESSDDAPKLKVVSSTGNKTYVPFPLLPDNHRVTGAELKQIQAAGKTLGTGGSIGSVGSAGTVSTTISTLGSVGSVGTVGSGSD